MDTIERLRKKINDVLDNGIGMDELATNRFKYFSIYHISGQIMFRELKSPRTIVKLASMVDRLHRAEAVKFTIDNDGIYWIIIRSDGVHETHYTSLGLPPDGGYPIYYLSNVLPNF